MPKSTSAALKGDESNMPQVAWALNCRSLIAKAVLTPSGFPGLKFTLDACHMAGDDTCKPFTMATIAKVRYRIGNLSAERPDFSELDAIDEEIREEVKRIIMLNKDMLVQYWERAGQGVGLVWLMNNFKI
jgi:hypothetical protein